MDFIWHEPRKRTSSSEPRISISKQFISLNPPCKNQYFKSKEYVRIGYDVKENKLIFVPVDERGNGLKIIHNENSRQVYINAKKLLALFPFKKDAKGIYKCTWDETNKGVLVDMEKDKIK